MFDDEEAARWQDRIEEVIRRAGIEPSDPSGNESGDPLDWSADQVAAALAELRDQRDQARSEVQQVNNHAALVGQDLECTIVRLRDRLKAAVTELRALAQAHHEVYPGRRMFAVQVSPVAKERCQRIVAEHDADK